MAFAIKSHGNSYFAEKKLRQRWKKQIDEGVTNESLFEAGMWR